MQTKRRAAGIGFLLLLAVGMAVAQQTPPPPAPLMHETFETDAGNWTGMGDSGKVSITHDAAHVKEGKGALQFDYAVKKNEINVLIFPTPGAALEKMKSLHFWMYADYTTTMLVSLQEKDGGRFATTFHVKGGVWQEVRLGYSDFLLGDEKDDPKDANGKLDLDKVEGIGIADYGQLFAQSEDANLVTLLNVQKGPHTLYMDDFTVSTETIAPELPATAKERSLDTLSRPQLSWIPIGDVKLSAATGKPLTGSSLKADYHQAPGKAIGFVKRFQRGTLKGMDQLTFTAAATKPTKLVVQLEQIGGGKYRTIIDVPGNSEVKELVLPFANFEMADDSGDRNGHFTADQVNQLVILDASGIVDGSDTDNTFWITKLRTSPK